MREKGFNADSADHLPHPQLVISTNVSIVGIQLKKCILTARRMKIPGFAVTATLDIEPFLYSFYTQTKTTEFANRRQVQ